MLADWVSALQREGCRPQRSGDGYKALCPAHDDTNPILTLGEGDRQAVVAYCHRGCRFEDIWGRLGLDPGGNGAGAPR